MKVLITYPPLKDNKGIALLSQNRQFQYFNNPTLIFPVVLATAATMLRDNGYEVLWKDAIADGTGYDDYMAYLDREKPDLIAIETKTPVVKSHWATINDIKARFGGAYGPKIVLMGDHVTGLPQETLEQSKTDFSLTGGDFDFMLLDLCQYLEKKKPVLKAGFWYREDGVIKNTGKFTLDSNLNDAPIIDRRLTQSHLYNIEHNMAGRKFEYTMAGRDCPYGKCTFCSWTALFPNFRVRKPENFLDEIGHLIDECHIQEIFDDSGTFPAGGWLKNFCDGMVERGYHKKIAVSCNIRQDYLTEKNCALMKKANFRLLKMGLESVSQKTIDMLDKKTDVTQIEQACRTAKRAGLTMHLTIMVGYPWETRQDALNTQNFAKSLMKKGLIDLLQCTVIIPYPGLPIYKQAVENDWLRVPANAYERFDMSEPVCKTPDMSPEEVMEMCRKVYHSFLTPQYIYQRLRSIKSLNDLKYNLTGAKAVFGHLLDFNRPVNPGAR